MLTALQSTILYRITMGSVVASAPTVGSNHEIYDYKGVRFGLIDIGGQTSLRSSWSQYFVGTAAIILVIDSSDVRRLPLAKAELQKLVADEVSS
jgi:GTPase SAR1 family protein